MPTKQEYRMINRKVMTDTYKLCKEHEVLKEAIKYSINNSKVIYEHDMLNVPIINGDTNIVVSGKRSYEAASFYKGKKIAVLNFANNHHIGGSPYSAGAQEESLCRCSTLLPCLEAHKKDFYQYHIELYENGKIDNYGNDDIIYIPDVVVFKTDVSEPQLMDEKDWFKVDVITSAAPQVKYGYDENKLYFELKARIKRILDIAYLNNV